MHSVKSQSADLLGSIARIVFIATSAVGVSIALAQDVGETELPPVELYDGPVVDGVRQGFGSLTRVDGSIYEGEFVDGLPSDSAGKLLFPDGREYRGEVEAGRMHGNGTLEFANGDKYVGSFDTDEIMGKGTFFWVATNATYQGTFQAGELHGRGEMRWPDGRSYAGEFSQGRRHGYGLFSLPDGSQFRGNFDAGERHGYGVFANGEGDLEFQQWERDVLKSRQSIEVVEHCQLRIDERDWMFDGPDCINGHAHGSGTAVRLDGWAYIRDGTFVVGNLTSGEITSMNAESR